MFLSKFPPKFGWQKIRSTDAAPGISEVFLLNIHFVGLWDLGILRFVLEVLLKILLKWIWLIDWDYSISSALFVSELRLWQLNLDILAEKSRQQAWQFLRPMELRCEVREWLWGGEWGVRGVMVCCWFGYITSALVLSLVFWPLY